MRDTNFLYNTYLFTYSVYVTVMTIALNNKQIKFLTDFVALAKKLNRNKDKVGRTSLLLLLADG